MNVPFILASDYDETLNRSKDPFQTGRNIAALSNLHDEGYVVVIATGRELENLQKDCPDITTFANYIVCLDGGSLYAMEGGIPKEKRRWMIEHAEIQQIQQMVKDLDGKTIVHVFSMVGSEKREGISCGSSKIRIAFADKGAAIEFKRQLCAINAGTVFYEIPRELNFDNDCLCKEVPEITYVVEIMPAGGKLVAIEYLAQLIGAAVGFCAGDAENDSQMIEHYGPQRAAWIESEFSPSDRKGVPAFLNLEAALCDKGLI